MLGVARSEVRALSGAGINDLVALETWQSDSEIANITQSGEIHMADIQQLEESIVSLSLLEAAELVKKLESRLGVRQRRRLRLKRRPNSRLF